MFKTQLKTASPAVFLVSPDIDRDAALGVKWLSGGQGRQTLGLMGVEDKYNRPSSLDEEKARVLGFLEHTNQLNWMIQADGRIVGAIWVDLDPTEFIKAPAVSLMIGDPHARGQGIGEAALASVVDFLAPEGYPAVFARHLTTNKASAALLKKVGFTNDGQVYVGDDGFHWQNLHFEAKAKEL